MALIGAFDDGYQLIVLASVAGALQNATCALQVLALSAILMEQYRSILRPPLGMLSRSWGLTTTRSSTGSSVISSRDLS